MNSKLAYTSCIWLMGKGGIKRFLQQLLGYRAAYSIQPDVGDVNSEWFQCAQHFANCLTDINLLHFIIMLWHSSYIICIYTRESWKIKTLIRPSQLFHVIEDYISVAHWGKWTRILAIKANQPKIPGRAVSGQTYDPFAGQQCKYDGNLLPLLVGFFFLLFGLFIFFFLESSAHILGHFYP